MNVRRTCVIGVLACVLATVASLTAAAAPTAKQRIAIEERVTLGASGGTFRLIPLTPGPLKEDSGTFTFSATQRPTVIRDGQTVTTYKGVDMLKGKLGTLRIPGVNTSLDAGGGFQAGTSTWSVAGGTGAYADLRGGGRGAVVGTPKGIVLGRNEGYVSTP